jgi:periplasmic protein TonB
MDSSTEPHRALAGGRRPRRVPAAGLPVRRDSRRVSSLISLIVHALIIMLLIAPVIHTGDVEEKPQGSGGPGPAGGGGGGRNGTGGVREHVQFVQVAPPPTPAPKAVVPPPVIAPTPKPVVAPPPVVKPPEPAPEAKPVDTKPEVKTAEATSPTAGTGGGSGRDGTNGSGPGSGGGVGSGIGPGRGSGTGPGTGGGVQANFPPTPTELFIPPLPMPDKVRGFHLVAEYDVDSTGKIVDFKFTPTRDGGYNKRLDEVLRSFKFRPGTTPDGKPIRMKAQIIYDF